MPRHFVRGYGGTWRERSHDRWRQGWEWAREKLPDFAASDGSLESFDRMKEILESGFDPVERTKRVLRVIQTARGVDADLAKAYAIADLAKKKGASIDRRANIVRFHDAFWGGVHEFATVEAHRLFEADPDRDMKATQKLCRDLWRYADLPGTWDEWLDLTGGQSLGPRLTAWAEAERRAGCRPLP